ncbi:MAG: hypothetical protein IJS71_08160 [Clostridia bacterium]|nr:hypothetical protein [Clostridia bacterium]
MKKIGKIKIVYNKDKDEFQLWSRRYGEDEWEFARGCKCVCRAGEEVEIAAYVHWSILGEIRRFLALGFELVDEGDEV